MVFNINSGNLKLNTLKCFSKKTERIMTTIKKYKVVLGTLKTHQTVILVSKLRKKLKMTNHEHWKTYRHIFLGSQEIHNETSLK